MSFLFIHFFKHICLLIVITLLFLSFISLISSHVINVADVDEKNVFEKNFHDELSSIPSQIESANPSKPKTPKFMNFQQWAAVQKIDKAMTSIKKDQSVFIINPIFWTQASIFVGKKKIFFWKHENPISSMTLISIWQYWTKTIKSTLR